MAVPKRKMSRSNTRSRRANWKASAPDLVEVDVTSAGGRRTVVVPRRLVKAARLGLVEGVPVD
ncbi:50S ribosomal protein L32 [Mobilicoccus massiliensis]|uniref:50S ribosomal protein L32 n=1 Tax=Mobilicoccus massiliensis TaxID=1522310 RepID=UPI00058B26E8|nr:50S ribosomal protein L32 [Mobilicoccus massiliensis]